MGFCSGSTFTFLFQLAVSIDELLVLVAAAIYTIRVSLLLSCPSTLTETDRSGEEHRPTPIFNLES